MILDTPIGKFALHIRHTAPNDNRGHSEATIHPAVSDTRVCSLNERPCGTPGMVTGVASCSKSDNFSRTKGRKIAIAKAMLLANLPRKDRAVIWKRYWELRGGIGK